MGTSALTRDTLRLLGFDPWDPLVLNVATVARMVATVVARGDGDGGGCVEEEDEDEEE